MSVWETTSWGFPRLKSPRSRNSVQRHDRMNYTRIVEDGHKRDCMACGQKVWSKRPCAGCRRTRAARKRDSDPRTWNKFEAGTESREETPSP